MRQTSRLHGSHSASYGGRFAIGQRPHPAVGPSPGEPAKALGLAAAKVAPRVRLAGLEFDQLIEAEVIQHIVEALRTARGGWVATPNVDICRQVSRDPAQRALLQQAALVVPDGMPLIWASRLGGDRIAERVTGSSLIFSLTRAAAEHGRSIYLLGGRPGVPDRAGEELARQNPGLAVAGYSSPPMGFDNTEDGRTTVCQDLIRAAPDIVYVGLGYPKQERLIAEVAPALPHTWFIACGAAIAFAAGALPRAPIWMQRSGLEWLFRLLNEPRRLIRRYLVSDAPYAIRLLAFAAARGARTRLGRSSRSRTRAGRLMPSKKRPAAET